MDVRAVLALRTEAILGELLALALLPQVEGVRELTRVALFAQAALIVLANEVGDARALVLGNVVSVWAGRTFSAAASDEVGADGTVDF